MTTKQQTAALWIADYGSPINREYGIVQHDPGIIGWRVGVDMGTEYIHTISILFGSKSDCERAAAWLNRELPPCLDENELFRQFIERFGSLKGLRREMIPEVCRF